MCKSVFVVGWMHLCMCTYVSILKIHKQTVPDTPSNLTK